MVSFSDFGCPVATCGYVPAKICTDDAQFFFCGDQSKLSKDERGRFNVKLYVSTTLSAGRCTFCRKFDVSLWSFQGERSSPTRTSDLQRKIKEKKKKKAQKIIILNKVIITFKKLKKQKQKNLRSFCISEERPRVLVQL